MFLAEMSKERDGDNEDAAIDLDDAEFPDFREGLEVGVLPENFVGGLVDLVRFSIYLSGPFDTKHLPLHYLLQDDGFEDEGNENEGVENNGPRDSYESYTGGGGGEGLNFDDSWHPSNYQQVKSNRNLPINRNGERYVPSSEDEECDEEEEEDEEHDGEEEEHDEEEEEVEERDEEKEEVEECDEEKEEVEERDEEEEEDQDQEFTDGDVQTPSQSKKRSRSTSRDSSEESGSVTPKRRCEEPVWRCVGET